MKIKKISKFIFIVLLLSSAHFCQDEGSEPSNNSIPTLDGRGGGLIAFYSERDGNPEIYIMNADGTAQTRLTQNNAQDLAPDISPDGSKIVFVSNRNGNFEIYTMNIDGATTIRLTNNTADDSYPYWSADGTKIIFSSKQDGNNYEIYIMNADGTDQTRITNTVENEEWAYLSPDFTKIVYAAGTFLEYDIYTMNIDGSNVEPFVVMPNLQALPKWSRDGERIAYNNAVFTSGNFIGDIYLINADGTNHIKITESNGAFVNEDPYWSPTGDQLVFQSNRSGNFQIYIMNADGSNQSRLTNHQGNDYWPSWGSE
ncbi:MAG: hypothetical protein A2V66_05615 [Ignavibacteria bacterium RBG_13_36_8]|nr:MAG: hypothetical protein A2V66_05615 [Ignavibacteria bacterium RBG_13_36_8]